MRKLMGSVKNTPPGSLARISVTKEHYKKLRPAKGQTIYTHPCPVHSSETPRLPMLVMYRGPEGQSVNAGYEYVCVFCWNPVQAVGGLKEPKGALLMVKYRGEWRSREVTILDHKRKIMQPKSKAESSRYLLYTNRCGPEGHFPLTFHISLLKLAGPENAEKYGWPWTCRSEARVCLFCWLYWDEKPTQETEIPPWAEKSS